MNNTKFTLFDLLWDTAFDWIESEKKDKNSVVGNLVKYVEKQNKLRDAQINAIKIYLWLKEKGNNKKLSELIKDGTVFDNDRIAFYSGEYDYFDKPAKRYLNRYLQDSGITDLDPYLRTPLPYEEYENLIDNLFEDFNYPNYLFSLPMGAGKTFLIAALIYIDLYLAETFKDNNKYCRNFIVIAPTAKKTAIIPALKTIKLFNPEWILPKTEAKKIKRLLKIEVLDEIAKNDKLQNQNPNLAKITRTISGHPYGNVFILNAEKVIPNFEINDIDFDDLPLVQQTKISRATHIKNKLSEMNDIMVFLDEAHHTYAKDSETKKLRKQLDIINQNNNIKCCVGMSGTPYVDRKVQFNNKTLKLQDIQDIVYYYPLTEGIGNFLKKPLIKKHSNEELLISNALTDFFNNYDIEYNNGTKSKIAFYCPSIAKLNLEILPLINEWYEKNQRDKSEILAYYTESNKDFILPKENLIEFMNLDNPSSRKRVVLLVAVGTEGWDCKSLTSVVLPRKDSAKNLVLQTTCRCLREVTNAENEKALIYVNDSNYDVLNNELKKNYHLTIDDLNNNEKEFKEYPVYKRINTLGKLKYKNVYFQYVENIENKTENDYVEMLNSYDFDLFKEKYPFSNRVLSTTITDLGLDEAISYSEMENQESYNYSFVDFIYELEKSSFGRITCAELIKYRKNLEKIYKKITEKNNFSWIINHPSISTYDICKDITSIFTEKVKTHKEEITKDTEINLLDWDVTNKPLIRVLREDSNKIYPINAYDDIEEDEDSYEDNVNELKRRYEDKMKIANKEKSFNYLPYKMDSTYEFDLLAFALANLNSLDIEIYYNGYKNKDLTSFKIETPYGVYTPDFIAIKRDKNEIEKILIIESKADPYNTDNKEKFVKEYFLKHNPTYTYIKINDSKNELKEQEKLLNMINEFSK